MAVVDVAVAVGATVGLEGAAAGIAGGAILGAGIGAGYSLLTGDGNVLNSALTGAALGGAGMGLAGAGAAATPAISGVEAATSASPALQAAQGLTSADVAGLNQAALSQGVFAEGSAALPGSNLAVAPATVSTPSASTLLDTQMPSIADKGVGLTSGAVDAQLQEGLTGAGKTALNLKGADMLKYGLAGTAALSMLGGQKSKGLPGASGSSSPSMIRPYSYSQVKNPNYGQPGEPYFIQSYTAQTPYKAAAGGLMAVGGGVGNMYPQSQQEHTNFATPTQMPTSAEVVNADYDQVTNPYTGDMPRFADGGQVDPNQFPPQVQPAQLVAPTTTYTPAPQAPTQLQQQIADYNKGIAAAANQEYNVAPPPLATLPGGGQGASASDLRKIINQYYVQNLGRQGEEAGLTDWVSRVQNQGTSLADIVKGIQGSNEGIVYQDYKNLLGRNPDAEGSAYWQKALQSGATPEDIRKSIMGSQEYLKLHPEYAAAQKAEADYYAAPVTQETFDAEAYLKANPDVTTARWTGTPWQHYVEATSKGENRVAPKLAYQAPVTTTTANTGYTYNPITGTFGSPVTGATTTSAASNAMYTAPDGSLWTNKQAYDRAHPVGEAAGGLLAGYASGGLPGYNLGSYSDGGRLLKGPGDGMSDNIPASIADKQPARLADGEFVVPADVVSHLGNGSTDAGAKRLYAMMDNVRKARTGSKKQGKQIKADKYLPT